MTLKKRYRSRPPKKGNPTLRTGSQYSNVVMKQEQDTNSNAFSSCNFHPRVENRRLEPGNRQQKNEAARMEKQALIEWVGAWEGETATSSATETGATQLLGLLASQWPWERTKVEDDQQCIHQTTIGFLHFTIDCGRRLPSERIRSPASPRDYEMATMER